MPQTPSNGMPPATPYDVPITLMSETEATMDALEKMFDDHRPVIAARVMIDAPSSPACTQLLDTFFADDRYVVCGGACKRVVHVRVLIFLAA